VVGAAVLGDVGVAVVVAGDVGVAVVVAGDVGVAVVVAGDVKVDAVVAGDVKVDAVVAGDVDAAVVVVGDDPVVVVGADDDAAATAAVAPPMPATKDANVMTDAIRLRCIVTHFQRLRTTSLRTRTIQVVDVAAPLRHTVRTGLTAGCGFGVCPSNPINYAAHQLSIMRGGQADRRVSAHSGNVRGPPPEI
jgi:hypothetical protein